MDENEFLKTGMEVVLRPVTDIAENALGLLGGDWLSEKRARNRTKLKNETAEILRKSGAEIDDDPSPSVITPLLSAAQDESREELVYLWAQLLAGAMDPKRRQSYRREFLEIAKQLEPVDVLVLPELSTSAALLPSRMDDIAKRLEINAAQVELSFISLHRLGLIAPALDRFNDPRAQPFLTTLGREFLRAVSSEPIANRKVVG